jgi:hypothetical protein
VFVLFSPKDSFLSNLCQREVSSGGDLGLLVNCNMLVMLLAW